MDSEYAAFLAWKQSNPSKTQAMDEQRQQQNVDQQTDQDLSELAAPPAKKSCKEQLWKLFKPKYMLIFRLCDGKFSY